MCGFIVRGLACARAAWCFLSVMLRVVSLLECAFGWRCDSQLSFAALLLRCGLRFRCCVLPDQHVGEGRECVLSGSETNKIFRNVCLGETTEYMSWMLFSGMMCTHVEITGSGGTKMCPEKGVVHGRPGAWSRGPKEGCRSRNVP